MVGGIEEGTQQGDALGGVVPTLEFSGNFGGLDPDGIGACADPVAAKAKAAREFGAAGEATQLGTQQALGVSKVAPVGVGVGGNDQVRSEPAQQLGQVTAAKQDGAGFDQVLKLHQAPVGLMQPGGVLLDPVVESNSAPVGAAAVLEHLLDPHLPARIPLAQPVPQGPGGGVVGGAATGGEDQDPHRAMVPLAGLALAPCSGLGAASDSSLVPPRRFQAG